MTRMKHQSRQGSAHTTPFGTALRQPTGDKSRRGQHGMLGILLGGGLSLCVTGCQLMGPSLQVPRTAPQQSQWYAPALSVAAVPTSDAVPSSEAVPSSDAGQHRPAHKQEPHTVNGENAASHHQPAHYLSSNLQSSNTQSTDQQSLPSQSEPLQQASVVTSQLLSQVRAEQHWPAITMAVALQGQLLWSGASGYADLAAQIPASTRTQFRLGSTSKAVTSTLLARSVALQRVALDTPISRYKTDLPNPAWQPMTLRQLMSHTAGFPGYEDNTDRLGKLRSWLKWRQYTDVDQALEIFDDSELLAAPGQKFHYSSFDINLASAVLQSAVKTPFLAYLAQEVTEPLQLEALAAAEVPNPHQAQFYELDDGDATLHRPVDLSQKWAAGGLAATSVDLVKIGSAWFNPDYIPADVQQAFWQVQPLANGQPNEQFYALGWRHFTQQALYCDQANPLAQQVSFVHHGGVSDGAQSLLVIYPKWQLVVAVNINTQTTQWCDFAREVSRLTKPFLQTVAPELFIPAT